MPQTGQVLNPGDESTGEAVRRHRQAMEELNPKSAPVDTPVTPQSTSPKDKINPKARYGDKPKETRYDVTEALKPLGSFKSGTPYIPKTGVYKLHEGEAVVPKEKNTMNAADAMAGITGKSKPPKKEIKEMVHTKTHNNKHIVTHRHHHPEHHPDETHAFDNMGDVHSHMEDHAGMPNEGEAAPAAGAEAPAPLTAAPSPAPAAAPTPGM